MDRVNSKTRVLFAIAAGVFGIALPRSAIAAGKEWHALTPEGKAGTRAEIALDAAASSLDFTAIDVTIHGFWIESVKGADGVTYQRIEIPGLPGLQQLGAPSVPAVRALLGVATAAGEVKLVKAALSNVKSFGGLNVWPAGIPELDESIDPDSSPGPAGDSGGSPEVFQKNKAIYELKTPWPPTNGPGATAVGPLLKAVRGAACEAYPVHCIPADQRVDVAVNSRFEFSHKGTPLPASEITKDSYLLAASTVANWKAIATAWLPNLKFYSARYLFVTPKALVPTLQPLIDQKKAHGFQVTVIHTESISATVAGVRNAIQGWYSLGKSSMDHYCLLVGDTTVIPLGSGPSAIPTDDLYASPSDGDLCEEVYVGRLSCDDSADLGNQVAKILAYEDHPSLFGPYGKALLVAHDEGAPGKYQGAQEAVRAASYAVPPTFLTAYGSTGATNAQVRSAIDAGLGLVCYRGHGDTNIWWQWNTASQDFHKNDVLALANAAMRPIVWSFCCTNQDLAAYAGTNTDCLGEAWLEAATTGAIAHYGATVPSGTYENHELDFRMFEAVYDLGLVTHAQAIEYAEAQMAAAYPSGKNAWMYLLLGDPALKIRRKAPLELVLDLPLAVELCPIPGPPCDIGIKVALPDGKPLAGALVSLWKQGGGADGSDEVLTNAYTSSTGVAALSVQPKTAGVIHYSVRDDSGNVETGTIAVKACTAKAANASYGAGKAGTLGVPVLTALDLPVVGAVGSIRLAQALPGALPTLVLGASSASVSFDKGTLLVAPALVMPLPFKVAADGTLTLAGLIPDDPSLCGISLYHQMLIPDPKAAGPYHLAMSNGLQRTLGS